MKRKIGCGLQAIIALTVIYILETAILGAICRFMSHVPYKLVAPPVVILAMVLAWVAIFVDMKKAGEQ